MLSSTGRRRPVISEQLIDCFQIRRRKMDDVERIQSENENLRKIRNRLMQWESKTDPLAALSIQQEEHLDVLTNLWRDSGAIGESTPPRMANV